MALAQPSTQGFIKIDSIRDGMLLLKGGAMRSILRVSSLNFALKSQEEQEAIIFEYQNFLNSLDFPIQIYINSRFINIDDYADQLKKQAENQTNQLLKVQTQEYISFIREFVQNNSVISTDFFVIIPLTIYEAQADKKGGVFGSLGKLFRREKVSEAEEERFTHYHTQLMQRTDFVSAGLHRMGLTTQLLTTEELVKFFWNIYNPRGLRKRSLLKPLYER